MGDIYVYIYRVFELVPIETIIWAVLYTYFITSVYEYYLLKSKNKIIFSTRFYLFIATLFFGFAIFLLLLYGGNDLRIPYFYTFFIGIFYGFPIMVGFVKLKKEFTKFLVTCIPFIVMLFVGEISALMTKHWGFSGGEYMGTITLNSVITFPFEELIWILIGVPAFLYVYQCLKEG